MGRRRRRGPHGHGAGPVRPLHDAPRGPFAPEIRIQPPPLGLGRSTAIRKLGAVRTFYDFLVQEGWFEATPVPSTRAWPMKAPRPLPSFLGKSEVERLLEACPGQTPAQIRDRAILELLYASGIRLAEIAGLDVGDLDPLRSTATVTGKGGQEREVLLRVPRRTSGLSTTCGGDAPYWPAPGHPAAARCG